MMDPVVFEVLRHAVESIPEQMGAALQRSAFSANIKERMDESCAVFGPGTEMIAQAEHIPVHLGAMPSAIRAVTDSCRSSEGDQIMMNDPYNGGTHLPDITLVKPVFYGSELVGYTANRAHHADVGGTTPGSMPGNSTVLQEEGVIIHPTHAVKDGELCSAVSKFASKTRDPDERIGDLRAQIGANERGAKELMEVMDRFGRETYFQFLEESLEYSEERTRKTICDINDGTYSATSSMEWKEEVSLSLELTIDGDEIYFDLTGTSPQVEGNINAPRPVTLSAVYYVVRCLIPEDIPMNEGVYRPITVSIPEGSLLNPNYPAAVSAGNVETSQMVVELILDALRQAMPDKIPAQCQGTMNNMIIGNDDFSYYETIGGGAGASSYGIGESGVHVHMTNTKNTPIEALENEYPLRVLRYKLRENSGGNGYHRGGDGMIREIEVLQDALLSIQSQRRKHGAKGTMGGEDGTTGNNILMMEDDVQELEGHVTVPMEKGWRIRIETPGGGGWGSQNVD